MNAYCLLNHALTQNQVAELRETYGAESIVMPPQALQSLWAQMPAEREFDKDALEKIAAWLSQAQTGDVVVVQGEAGSTFAIVDCALKKGLVPLHAATRRIAKERCDGEKVFREYVFEHVCFRRYRYFDDIVN